MTRVAAFDCGTNSLRLLVADIDVEAGTSEDLVREMRIVRLGQGVDRTGRIADASLQRVFGAVEEYMEMVQEHDVKRHPVLRDIGGPGRRELRGVPPRHPGAHRRRARRCSTATRRPGSASPARRATCLPLPEPLLVIDIGGGSTELILGNADGSVVAAESLDIGSVRLNERHLAGDPPSKDEIAAAVADIDAALDGCSVDPAEAGAVIGVAGTVTTLAAAVLDLDAYDPTLIHHSVLRPDAVQGAVSQAARAEVTQRKALPYMHPGRADVIGAGGLILDRVLRRTTVSSMLVSEHDILDGIAWSLAAPSPRQMGRTDAPSTHADDQARPSSGGETWVAPKPPSTSPRSVREPRGLQAGAEAAAFFVLRRTVREFLDDGGTDLAAALTYYSVLAIFPALIALMSLVGVFGQRRESIDRSWRSSRRWSPATRSTGSGSRSPSSPPRRAPGSRWSSVCSVRSGPPRGTSVPSAAR